MFFAKSATDLMQRLAGLPTTPHLDLLLRGKPKPFPLLHKHHLQKTALYQMVLHRPFELAALIGQMGPGTANARLPNQLMKGQRSVMAVMDWRKIKLFQFSDLLCNLVHMVIALFGSTALSPSSMC